MRALAVWTLTLALFGASPAIASSGHGVGSSIGFGATAFDPAPGIGFELKLPALDLAFALPTARPGQLRVRLPLLQTVYAAAVRQQLDLRAEAFLLLVPCPCPPDHHMLRPVLGPKLGLRLSAQQGVTQPGFLVGARAGAEYVGPRRRFGLGVGIEPFFELQGGTAGVGRSSLVVGGGAFVVIDVTGYKKQRPAERAK